MAFARNALMVLDQLSGEGFDRPTVRDLMEAFEQEGYPFSSHDLRSLLRTPDQPDSIATHVDATRPIVELDEEVFDQTYGPLQAPSGSYVWTDAEIAGINPAHVWSLVDYGDRSCVVPGRALVDRVDSMVTRRACPDHNVVVTLEDSAQAGSHLPGDDYLTRIPYMYRDASNYKQFGSLVVKGKPTSAQLEALRGCLVDEDKFIPTQIGLSHLGAMADWPSWPCEDGHPWHELQLEQAEQTWLRGDCEEIFGTVDEFITAMTNASQHWDDAVDLDEL